MNFGILEGFLCELLKYDIKIVEILESESNKETSDDKFNRVDVLVKNDKEELTGCLRKSTIGHIVAVILMISTSLIVTKFFSEKPEAQLVTIVVPKPETVAQKTEPVPHVKMSEKKIKVTLVKSVIGTKQDHRATVRGLGLRRLNSSAELIDTPAVRGMIQKVQYLVKVEG